MTPALAVKPCRRCGATDRYASGDCRPCTLAREEARRARLSPDERARKREYMVGYTKRPGYSEQRKRLRSNPKYKAAQRVRFRRWRYGLSAEEQRTLENKQGGLCAACGDPMVTARGSYVDHDHETGKVRELLCTRCNFAVGHLLDSSARARLVAAYLERHGR